MGGYISPALSYTTKYLNKSGDFSRLAGTNLSKSSQDTDQTRAFNAKRASCIHFKILVTNPPILIKQLLFNSTIVRISIVLEVVCAGA